MPETFIVGLDVGGGTTERVAVDAVRTEWDRDDALHLFNADGQQVAEFPDARYAIHAEHLAE